MSYPVRLPVLDEEIQPAKVSSVPGERLAPLAPENSPATPVSLPGAASPVRQFAYLFAGNLTILFIGMGLFPLLPLYAARFGATSSQIGMYLGIVYAAIASGTLLAGWLAGRMPPRLLFILGALIGAPALLLLGQASSFWQVVVLTSAVWFSGGIGLALLSVFTGLLAGSGSRGRFFSLMFLTTPLGAVMGGAAANRLLAWQGYPLMFTVMAVVWSALILIGLFGLRGLPGASALPKQDAAAARGTSTAAAPGTGRVFYLLLLVSLLVWMSISMNRLGVSLEMQAQGFLAPQVAGASVVGGLAAIPLSLLVAALSDRVDRRAFLMVGFLLVGASALVFLQAGRLWHFWLGTILIMASMGINSSITSAFATDLLPPAALKSGLSWLATMSWAANIVSFTGSGLLVERFGNSTLFLVAGLLTVVSAGVLGLLVWAGRVRRPAASLQDCPPAPAWQNCP